MSALRRARCDSRQNVSTTNPNTNATGSICRSKLFAGAVIITPMSSKIGRAHV